MRKKIVTLAVAFACSFMVLAAQCGEEDDLGDHMEDLGDHMEEAGDEMEDAIDDITD